jgi:hypothetical protein
MDTEETVKLQIKSSEWICGEVDKLLRQYRRARTNRERAKLLPQLESMKGRLMLESRTIEGFIDSILDEGF